jgi:ribosomal protein L17
MAEMEQQTELKKWKKASQKKKEKNLFRLITSGELQKIDDFSQDLVRNEQSQDSLRDYMTAMLPFIIETTNESMQQLKPEIEKMSNEVGDSFISSMISKLVEHDKIQEYMTIIGTFNKNLEKMIDLMKEEQEKEKSEEKVITFHDCNPVDDTITKEFWKDLFDDLDIEDE